MKEMAMPQEDQNTQQDHSAIAAQIPNTGSSFVAQGQKTGCYNAGNKGKPGVLVISSRLGGTRTKPHHKDSYPRGLNTPWLDDKSPSQYGENQVTARLARS